MRRPHPLVLLLALAVLGCASSGVEKAPRRSRNVITEDEIQNFTSLTAYEVVQRLRPAWLRGRGGRTAAAPAGHFAYIFVDGSPYGELQSLQGFRVEQIQELRYVPPQDAVTRYGGEYMGGVILVTTKR